MEGLPGTLPMLQAGRPGCNLCLCPYQAPQPSSDLTVVHPNSSFHPPLIPALPFPTPALTYPAETRPEALGSGAPSRESEKCSWESERFSLNSWRSFLIQGILDDNLKEGKLSTS